MKRIIQKLCAVLLLMFTAVGSFVIFRAAGIAVNAEDVDVSHDYEYTIQNNQVTITKYIGSDTEVMIPEEIEGLPVTVIGSKAFYEYTGLASLTVPDNVTSIRDSAFYGCTGLKRLVLYNANISLGQSAFSQCEQLQSVGSIGSDTDIQMNWPATVSGKYRTSYLFSNIKYVYVPEGVTAIDAYAFLNFDIIFISLPKSLVTIESSAFGGCSRLAGGAVLYAGTEDEWNQIAIGNSGNGFLTQAAKSYGIEAYIVEYANTTSQPYVELKNKQEPLTLRNKTPGKPQKSLTGKTVHFDCGEEGPIVEDLTQNVTITYSFTHWISSADQKQYQPGDIYDLNQNTVMTAYYKENVFEYPISLPTPEREEYTFAGWYKEPEFIHKASIYNSYNPEEDGETLYARWISNDSYLSTGKSFNIAMKKLAGNESASSASDTNSTITVFGRSSTKPAANVTTADISAAGNGSIIAWVEPQGKKRINWYSDSEKVYLNKDSSQMFSYFTSLSNINLDGLDSGVVENMSMMFLHTAVPSAAFLSEMNTSNVRSMGYLFNICSNLKTADLSFMNTENVTDMSGMFAMCSSLTNVNLSSFSTANVTTFEGMFNFCTQLTELDLSNFNTSKCTTFYGMFLNCNKIKSLDLSNFDTSNAKWISNMFQSCKSLNDLDISGFSTEKVQYDTDIFDSCSSLKRINLSPDFILKDGKFPTVPNNDTYLSRWEKEGNSDPEKRYTYIEMKEQTPYVSDPGTYVWVRKDVSFTVNHYQKNTIDPTGYTLIESEELPTKINTEIKLKDYTKEYSGYVFTGGYTEGDTVRPETDPVDSVTVKNNLTVLNLYYDLYPYNYYVNEDNTVTISKYTGSDKEVTLPETIDDKPVKRIGENTFRGRTDITAVTIPESISEIAANAFSGCTSLLSIRIPAGMELIENAAFDQCTGLKDIYYPLGEPAWNEIIPDDYETSALFTAEKHFCCDGHDWGEWTVTKEPACEEDGEEQRICSHDPSHIETRAIPALGHSWQMLRCMWDENYASAVIIIECSRCAETKALIAKVTSEITAPTCEGEGKTSYTASAEYEGNTYTDQKEFTSPALGHDWGEWTVIKEAGCEEDGQEQRVCKHDETHVETRALPATGHSWADPVYTWAEDINTATASITCLHNEAHVISETVDTKREIISEAGPETEGKIIYTAEFENEKFETQVKEVITPATGYTYQEPVYAWSDDNTTVTALAVSNEDPEVFQTETVKTEFIVTKQPGCETEGTGIYKAVFTNILFSEQTKETAIEATGHDWSEWTYVKEPTCTEDGEEKRVCRHDETHAETRPVPALGHEWKVRTCTWGEDYKTAVLIVECSRCQETKALIAKVTSETEAPSCEKEGRTTYTAAAEYEGKTFSDIKEVTVPALGHKWDEGKITKEPTCTEAGVRTYTCQNDSSHTKTEEIPATGHDWSEWTVSRKASCEEAGEEKRICKHDETHVETKEIPALGHEYELKEWKWSEDNSKAEAIFECKNDKTHTKTEEAKLTVKEEDTTRTITAEVTFEGKTYTYTKTETIKPEPVKDEIIRLAGADRFDTSIKIAEAFMQAKKIDKLDSVILANGINFADALAGSYLSYVKNAPILITWEGMGDYKPYNQINAFIKANVKEGGTIYVLGGEEAVKPQTLTGLEKFKINRLAGDNRFETNLKILEETKVSDQDILVATGMNFADSLSASAVNRPILLVWEQLFDMQKDYLKTLKGNDYYILGGELAVTPGVEKQLKAYGKVTRLAGSDRHETSVMIAETFCPDAESAVLALSTNFPDGLCGGPLASATNAPLILTIDVAKDPAVKHCRKHNIRKGYVLGGDTLVGDDTVQAIFNTDADIIVK